MQKLLPLSHFSAMDPRIVFVLVSLLSYPLSPKAQPIKPISKITLMGIVYCDTCSINTFSKHSYFLPDAEVHIDCKFKANSQEIAEQSSFSVNRTTDKFGVYKLEIPSVDGFECGEGLTMESFCEARLIGSSSSSCSVPVLKNTSDEITIKSRQNNICFYSLNPLSFKPPKRDTTLCRNNREELLSSLNSSKFFLPYFPPYNFPFSPSPQLPPFPTFPFPPLQPFGSWPFTHFPNSPPLSFPTNPPFLTFPFPPLPPFPSTPSLFFPSPPSPPMFDLRDPRTWIPFIPPSPPNNPQNQHP